MKKIILILVLLISFLSSESQVLRPSGLPSPNSTGYGKIGYQQADSGYLWNNARDTFPASKPTTIWHSNGNFYKTPGGTGAHWSIWVPATPGTVTSVTGLGALSFANPTTTPVGSLDTSKPNGITTRLRTQQQTDSIIGLISSGGGGTVLVVSVVSANGITGTVADPTSTPAITLGLNNITPTSVNSSGPITATLFSKNGGTSAQALRADGGVLTAGTGINITGGQIVNTSPSSGGTVQSVATTSAYGISSTVSNPTTTPNINIRVDTTLIPPYTDTLKYNGLATKTDVRSSSGAQTFQSVTDNGNTTTNSVTVSGKSLFANNSNIGVNGTLSGGNGFSSNAGFVNSTSNAIFATAIEQSFVLIGDTLKTWYRANTDSIYYAYSVDAMNETWTAGNSCHAVISASLYYPNVVLHNGTYYMSVNKGGTAGQNTNLFMYSSSNGINWTIMNSGTAVLTHSSTPTDWWNNIYNSGIGFKSNSNDTIFLLIEGMSTDLIEFRTGFSWTTLTALNFNTHLSVTTVLPSDVNYSNTGNPYLIYVPDRNCWLTVYGDYSSGTWCLRMAYANASVLANLSVQGNWKIAPGFGLQNLSVSDPTLCFNTSSNKGWRTILGYNYNQTQGYQAYSQVSLTQLYDAVTAPTTLQNFENVGIIETDVFNIGHRGATKLDYDTLSNSLLIKTATNANSTFDSLGIAGNGYITKVGSATNSDQTVITLDADSYQATTNNFGATLQFRAKNSTYGTRNILASITGKLTDQTAVNGAVVFKTVQNNGALIERARIDAGGISGVGSNITGNATELTAGNAILWQNNAYQSTPLITADGVMVYDVGSSSWKKIDKDQLTVYLNTGTTPFWNSTQWAAQAFTFASPTTPIRAMLYDNLDARWKAATSADMQAWLGYGGVTSVSVTTANGVSASVLSPTTTPALTFTLGGITPSSVNASGIVTATGGLSGTLTTAAQLNITSVGTLTSLSVSTFVSAGALSVTTINASLIDGTGDFVTIDNTGRQKKRTAAETRSDIGAGTGSGTLTNLTATDENGIAWTITNPTTTPNISATLGAITPSSVNSSGPITATTISGTQVVGTSLVGTLLTVSQPNITTVGTLGALTVTNTITAGTIYGALGTYNATNLKLTSSKINTIQDIATSSSPQFSGLKITSDQNYVGASGILGFGLWNIGTSSNNQVGLAIGDPVTVTNAVDVYLRSTSGTSRVYAAGGQISIGSSSGSPNILFDGSQGTTLYGALSGTSEILSGLLTTTGGNFTNIQVTNNTTVGGNLTVTGGISKTSGGSSTFAWTTDGGTVSIAGAISPFQGTSNITTITSGANLSITGSTSLSTLGIGNGVNNVISGIYNPTITSISNSGSLTITTGAYCSYSRIGNMVTVYASIDDTPTTTGFSAFTVSLPISSSVTALSAVAGTGGTATIYFPGAGQVAPNGNTATFGFFTTLISTAHSCFFSFQYRVQ